MLELIRTLCDALKLLMDKQGWVLSKKKTFTGREIDILDSSSFFSFFVVGEVVSKMCYNAVVNIRCPQLWRAPTKNRLLYHCSHRGMSSFRSLYVCSDLREKQS